MPRMKPDVPKELKAKARMRELAHAMDLAARVSGCSKSARYGSRGCWLPCNSTAWCRGGSISAHSPASKPPSLPASSARAVTAAPFDDAARRAIHVAERLQLGLLHCDTPYSTCYHDGRFP
jgi:hypothetical protein